jgi:FeS assembly protein IscX
MDWKDYVEIAEALNKLYPDASPVVMSDSELIEKVTALSNFAGEKQPPKEDYLSLISYRWIGIKGGGTSSYTPDPRDLCP